MRKGLFDLDGARLLGGEGGFGEDVIVDEDGLLEEKLLEGVQIGRHLRQIGDGPTPSLASLHFLLLLLHFSLLH